MYDLNVGRVFLSLVTAIGCPCWTVVKWSLFRIVEYYDLFPEVAMGSLDLAVRVRLIDEKDMDNYTVDDLFDHI